MDSLTTKPTDDEATIEVLDSKGVWHPCDIRWYKGKYKVAVVIRSKRNYMVGALEDIPNITYRPETPEIFTPFFVTVPRLLWRHKRA